MVFWLFDVPIMFKSNNEDSPILAFAIKPAFPVYAKNAFSAQGTGKTSATKAT